MKEVSGGVLRVPAHDDGGGGGEDQHQQVAVLTLGGEHRGLGADLAPVTNVMTIVTLITLTCIARWRPGLC